MTELLAWRGWHLSEPQQAISISAVQKAGVTPPIKYLDTPHLLSINMTPWLGPTLKADATPADNNTNGIYCLREKPSPVSANSSYFTKAAWGTIEISGTVAEYTGGYRAEVATVRKIFLDEVKAHWPWRKVHSQQSLANALSDKYQCEVEFVPSGILPKGEELMPEDSAIVRIQDRLFRLRLQSFTREAHFEDLYFYNSPNRYRPISPRGITWRFEGYEVEELNP